MTQHQISKTLKSLVIFRHLLEDKTIQKWIRLDSCGQDDQEQMIDRYADFACNLLQNGSNLTRYLLTLILEDDNIYLHRICRGESTADLDQCLQRELTLLQQISRFDGEPLRQQAGDETLFCWQTEAIDFQAAYQEHLAKIHTRGFGIFARYHMFILSDDGTPVPIKHPDPQRLDELFGYESERQKIIRNTQALLQGRPANNVLLYGDAGTGKSSTIKALANEFRKDGLRLIELKKNQLYRIPELIDSLSDNPLKFILFLDDLTFTSDDRDFCTLKAILEGGVSSRGSNVAIYVTSNHRHLIKETLQDRQGDEISVGDKIQEIASLSARFGLNITFSRPDKQLYSEIVCNLARDAGLQLDEQTLIIRAEAFAIRHGGRNPRTAKQFVDLLLSGVEQAE